VGAPDRSTPGTRTTTTGAPSATSTRGIAGGVHHGAIAGTVGKVAQGKRRDGVSARPSDDGPSLGAGALGPWAGCGAGGDDTGSATGSGGCWGCGACAGGGPVSPPVSAVTGGSGMPELSQSQSHVQFHVHSRPLPSPPRVVTSVGVPHQSNVHVQSHDGSPAAPGVAPSVVTWATGPSSPGLSIRIDTFTFVFAGLLAGPDCGMPGPRSSLVAGAFAPALDPLSAASAGGASHDQFQIQFHVHSRDARLPVSVDVDVGCPPQIVRNHVQFHGTVSGEREASSGKSDAD
jgi:hypothetical protein